MMLILQMVVLLASAIVLDDSFLHLRPPSASFRVGEPQEPRRRVAGLFPRGVAVAGRSTPSAAEGHKAFFRTGLDLTGMWCGGHSGGMDWQVRVLPQ